MAELGLAGRLADRLIDSRLVPLIVIAALLMGAYGLLQTPREDRPDIEVPLALISIPFPGAGVERVDELVARPVATWARQLESVVDVRSVASADAALVEVEFATSMSNAQAYGELKELFESHRTLLPPGVGAERIRTVGEELFAGLMVTLSSAVLDGFELHRIGTEVATRLEAVEGVRAVSVHGGQPRQVRVLPRVNELAAYGLDLVQLYEAIAAASLRLPAEPLRGEETRQVRVGSLPGSLAELAGIQVGAGPAGVIYLRDVADVVDGPAPYHSQSVHWGRAANVEVPAVSLSVTSIPQRNISAVTERTLRRIEDLKADLIPREVEVSIAFDAGRAATETVQSVLRNLASATVVVVIIILIGLGWRAALGVSFLIPAILSIVPFAYLLIGFTLNPVSIAAMIVAIGLITDDAVIIMENIRRHFTEAGERSRELTVRAVAEVGNPTILAALLIVVTLLPTAFISGEMGQYTRAIPIGTSLAILFSLTIALTVTPYAAYRLLRSTGSRDDAGSRRLEERYRGLLNPLFRHASLRWLVYVVLLLLLAGSASMVLFRAVQLTLVPFLDREVFVVELELPPGSSLETTLQAGAAVGRELRAYPEIKAYTLFAGTAGPLLMPLPGPPEIPAGMSHRATVFVQLPHKNERDRLSYEVDRALLEQLPAVLAPYEGRAWIRRIPSGPSSDNAIQAEIFGAGLEQQNALADRLATLLAEHPATAMIERFPKPVGPELQLHIDQVRSAARGVLPARTAAAVQIALTGRTATTLDLPGERQPVPVVLRLAEIERETIDSLNGLYIRNEQGNPIALPDLVDVVSGESEFHRYRSNQLPVVYVAAEVNRERSQPVSVQRDISDRLRSQDAEMPAVRWFSEPQGETGLTLYWGGEWSMTQQVYRELGLAALAVLLVIYTLLAGWFNSYRIPLLIMVPIPLVFIGVIPGHWIMGLDIAGLGVLGVIALAGIVVRNAVLLVDFAEQRIADGMDIEDALVRAVALRTRPILLTAGTVMFGSGALIFEPALQPLGLTLLSGVLVATLLTLVVIPTLYCHFFQRDAQP